MKPAKIPFIGAAFRFESVILTISPGFLCDCVCMCGGGGGGQFVQLYALTTFPPLVREVNEKSIKRLSFIPLCKSNGPLQHGLRQSLHAAGLLEK